MLGVMLQSVFGPASGAWICVVDDESDTFVGSRSSADIARFEAVFGSSKEEATGILQNSEPIKNVKPSWLREWLAAAFEHVLGPDEAAEPLGRRGALASRTLISLFGQPVPVSESTLPPCSPVQTGPAP